MSIVPMLIDHCSPTLASLKCGSLFSVTPEDMAQTRREAQALSDRAQGAGHPRNRRGRRARAVLSLSPRPAPLRARGRKGKRFPRRTGLP